MGAAVGGGVSPDVRGQEDLETLTQRETMAVLIGKELAAFLLEEHLALDSAAQPDKASSACCPKCGLAGMPAAYGGLGITTYVPPKTEPSSTLFAPANFILNTEGTAVTCPAGKTSQYRVHLVLCQSERSFGMLISLRIPVSYTGLSPDKITPMTGVHKRMNAEPRAERVLK